MSSCAPCNHCYLLGCKVEMKKTNTTRSRKQIERHQDMYRRQILLIDNMDKDHIGSRRTMRHDPPAKRDKAKNQAVKKQLHIESGNSTSGREGMVQCSGTRMAKKVMREMGNGLKRQFTGQNEERKRGRPGVIGAKSEVMGESNSKSAKDDVRNQDINQVGSLISRQTQ